MGDIHGRVLDDGADCVAVCDSCRTLPGLLPRRTSQYRAAWNRIALARAACLNRFARDASFPRRNSTAAEIIMRQSVLVLTRGTRPHLGRHRDSTSERTMSLRHTRCPD